MGVILPGVERDFPPVFSWDWDGKRLKFVMHFEIKNASHPKVGVFLAYTQNPIAKC